jgi:hypothetical protein
MDNPDPDGGAFICPAPNCRRVAYIGLGTRDRKGDDMYAYYVDGQEVVRAYVMGGRAICECGFQMLPEQLLEGGFGSALVEFASCESGMKRICKTLRAVGDVNPDVLRAAAARIVQISKRICRQSTNPRELNGRLASVVLGQLRGLFTDYGIRAIPHFPVFLDDDYGWYRGDMKFSVEAVVFTARFEALVRETRATRTVLVMIAGANRIDRNIARKIAGMSFM